jgi:hypothetical protein
LSSARTEDAAVTRKSQATTAFIGDLQERRGIATRS